MKKIILTGFLSTILSMNVFAGPFGIEMGMSLQEVTEICKSEPKLVEDDMYWIEPPKTNDHFDMYVVYIDPNYGVYRIGAIGKDISTTGHGTAVKSAFNDLVSSIEVIYGKYKKIDDLEYGSIWDEPQDFMMGLLKEERTLLASWEESSSAILPSSIKMIRVAAVAKSKSVGYLLLGYYSPNGDKVEAAKKAIQNLVF